MPHDSAGSHVSAVDFSEGHPASAVKTACHDVVLESITYSNTLS